MVDPRSISQNRRRESNDSAIRHFGTAYIFEKRAKSLRKYIQMLTFLGIAVPASIGAIIGSFNLSQSLQQIIVAIAALLALLQLTITIWSVVAKWNDNLAFYLESKSSNYRLASEYERLARSTDWSAEEFETRYQVLEAEGNIRTGQDNQIDLDEKEKRMGMRAGLRQYQRLCAGCGKIPIDMEPTNCPVCGKF